MAEEAAATRGVTIDIEQPPKDAIHDIAAVSELAETFIGKPEGMAAQLGLQQSRILIGRRA